MAAAEKSCSGPLGGPCAFMHYMSGPHGGHQSTGASHSTERSACALAQMKWGALCGGVTFLTDFIMRLRLFLHNVIVKLF